MNRSSVVRHRPPTWVRRTTLVVAYSVLGLVGVACGQAGANSDASTPTDSTITPGAAESPPTLSPGSIDSPTTGLDPTSDSAPATEPQPQTIRFAALPTGWAYLESKQVIASATSGLPLELATTGACAVEDTALGTIKATDVGQCTIIASQSGGSGYAAAESVTQSVEILQATASIENFEDFAREYQRGGFEIGLEAATSVGAPVSYVVLKTETDSGESPTCTVQGSALQIANVFQLPQDCVIEARVAATDKFTAASKQITVTISPIEVTIQPLTLVDISDTEAHVQVVLNGPWEIGQYSDCGAVTWDQSSARENYVLTVTLDKPNCTVTVYNSAPDGTVTNATQSLPIP